MIRDNKISAVLVSTDLERTQRFYEDTVGLTLSPETIKNHLVFQCGDGTSLLIDVLPVAAPQPAYFWTLHPFRRGNDCLTMAAPGR